MPCFCSFPSNLQDLGTALPKSGGERVYLERIFRRPHMLATCMFMAYVVLLGFSTPNAIVLGEYVLYALDTPANRWNVRAIGVFSVTILCYIHARHPRLGLKLINVLGAAKMLMLVIVVMSGIAGGFLGVGSDRPAPDRNSSLVATSDGSHGIVMGHHLDPDMVTHMPPAVVGAAVATAASAASSAGSGISTARRNFQDIWAGSSVQPYDYATALLKVIYCFRGYSTANQVMSDIKNPVRTLRLAAPLALVLVSLAYLAINIAFFLVVEKDDFRSAGVIVAGIFFRNLFGEGVGARFLPLFVIISAAGNIAATSFAQARVNEELSKDGLLPFASFWTTNGRFNADGSPATGSGKSAKPQAPPARGLLLHWLVSVAVIVLPPPGKIYSFLVDIGGYPVSVISVAIASGLLYLHRTPSERWTSPFRAPRAAIIIFATSNCLLLILPWVPPAGGRGESERFAYYAYPLSALAVIGSGALFWLWWRYRGAGRVVGSDNRSSQAADTATGRQSREGRRAKRQLTSPGWDRLKSAVAALRGRNASSNTSSRCAISSDEDNEDYQSARSLLSAEDRDSGPAEPVMLFSNIRRRAPCGCPSRH